MASDSSTGNAATGKKKAPKYGPMPSIDAVVDSLPFAVEYNHKIGRYAVAKEDIPAGTLVYVEKPFLRLPLSKYAAAVCTRCTRTLQENGAVPQPGNPCLPRYCVRCKAEGYPNALDKSLAALRIKLQDIAKNNSVEPLVLNALVVMDLQRSGIDIGKPPITATKIARDQIFDDIQTAVADYDSMPNMWERKSENWRKVFGATLRALHKELVALQDSSAVAGYTASPVTRLQADTAQISASIQQVSGPDSNTDTAIGLFPGFNLFHHTCAPNCTFIVTHSRVLVRTSEAVPKGTQLTVSHVSVLEPRSSRQAILESERFFTCACERCSSPLKSSIDRLIDGVVCYSCGQDVMLPCDAEENAAARLVYIANRAEDRKRLAKVKKVKGKKTGETESEQEQEEEEVVSEDIQFWKCCSCEFVMPSFTTDGNGPGDVINTGKELLQQGVAFVSVKHPEIAAKGESMLESVVAGVDGRLPIYHRFVTNALPILTSVAIRKNDNIKAINYAINSWQVDKELSGNRPTLQQLQYLNTIIDAAEAKASVAHSAVIKRQFEKKVKQAKEEANLIRPILYGPQK